MSLIAFATAALACSVSFSSNVVGTHPTDDWVVVRTESDGMRHPTIDLVVYDATGQERERFPILALDDEGSQSARGRNWTAAEARLNALGVVIDPAFAPVPMEIDNGLPSPIALGGATLSFTHGHTGSGYDARRTLQLAVDRDGVRHIDRTLADWMWEASANGWHYVYSVWALPEARAAIIEASGCVEPHVHIVELEPAETPSATTP